MVVATPKCGLAVGAPECGPVVAAPECGLAVSVPARVRPRGSVTAAHTLHANGKLWDNCSFTPEKCGKVSVSLTSSYIDIYRNVFLKICN